MGWVITAFYCLIVLGLLVPLVQILASSNGVTSGDLLGAYRAWFTWICSTIVIVCQILLLWVSVDGSRQRLKPRTPIVISAITAGFLFMVLLFAGGVSVVALVWGDNPPDWFYAPLAVITASWIVWGILFYRMWKDCADPVTRAVKWLIRGSVLELLVAVPAHVIVRRRHQCCAPGATAMGIATGIAIMLLSFGPSVLLLLRKRMERYEVKQAAS